VDATARLVATGGEDDRALVWDAQTGSVLFTCTGEPVCYRIIHQFTVSPVAGHEDSVVYVRFNRDQSLLASADMKGGVAVWAVATGTLVHRFEADADLEVTLLVRVPFTLVMVAQWLQWHPNGDELFCGDSGGGVWRFQVPDRTTQFFGGHGSGCTCGFVLSDGGAFEPR